MDVFDYIQTEDGDLLIRDGDFVVNESTKQHQRDLLIANKGEYKQHPTVGVGLNNYLLDEMEENEFKVMVTTEFENDGMRVGSIGVNDFDAAVIEAAYESEEDNSTR